MNLFLILLVVQIVICVALAGLILIQRSEGGALGMGGGPSGFMSARGAGNLLTRLTGIFAVLFFANSIGLTIVGNLTGKQTSVADKVDASKLPANAPLLPAQSSASSAASVSAPAAPSLNDLPLAGTAAPAAPAAASSSSQTKSAAPAAGPSFKLSMPSNTTTGNVGLSTSASTAPAPVLKVTPKPAKAASSASSAVHSTSAAPSSSASSTPSTPASSQ